jgi:hypothetical protein
MNWDDDHIDGMSKDDAVLLASLRAQPGETEHTSALRPRRRQ